MADNSANREVPPDMLASVEARLLKMLVEHLLDGEGEQGNTSCALIPSRCSLGST